MADGDLIARELLEALAVGGWSVGAELPPHTSGCFGCGPGNPSGLGVSAWAADGDAVDGEVVLDDRFVGAPGVAHGGAVAAVMDDLFGLVLVRVLVPAVTRELTVSYHRAVHLDEPCRLRAEVVTREGRRLLISGQLEQHDIVRATAEGWFVQIEPERFLTRYEPVEGD